MKLEIRIGRWVARAFCGGMCLLAAASAEAGEADPARSAAPKDPYKAIYKGYQAGFIEQISLPDEKRMKLSTEPRFFTLNRIHEDDRANALVTAALEKEQQGRYRDALKMYQIVIETYPDQLYRVSDFGVFVPIAQYCQRRILNFPANQLAHYRTLYDARAGESFEQSRRKHSLIGLSEVVDHMLATSYGSKAIAELGNAALDTGHYLAALEHYTTIRDFFPAAESGSRGLDLKIRLCHRMLGSTPAEPAETSGGSGDLSAEARSRLAKLVEDARPHRSPFHSQTVSPRAAAADDYTLFPPTADPLALDPPQWEQPLPASRLDFFVFSQPVVTENSVIYRYKNVVYCRSILNGELRWRNDLGGRAVWQSRPGRQYPQEELIVQDGLVFTVLSKGGPSLVALDEVTGQLKWAYGPMVAATEEEARMRFEAAPAGGPRTVYAGYVLDNIEGETHTDTEYGLIAFDSRTGRLRWRKALCRLAPGKFSAGFAVQRRNRIRSFTSPPLYHQGTVYYNTNAGATAALDARSGRIKWLMRYPYYDGVHDATRQFGRGGGYVKYTRIYFTPHSPMFWYNQRPLLIGEKLYVLPVDAAFLFCIDRRTGKVRWTKRKGVYVKRRGRMRLDDGGSTYLLGSLPSGELVMAYSVRKKPVQLIDPDSGKTVWSSPHALAYEEQPVLKYGVPAAGLGKPSSVPMNGRPFETGARPLLTSDNRLYLTSWNYIGWPIYCWATNLCVYNLAERKVVDRRRYYSGRLLGACHRAITSYAPQTLKSLEDLPHKDQQTKEHIRRLKLIVKDYVPVNPHGPFLPFSRVTFRRHGVPFEVRFGARSVAVAYDAAAVRRALAKETGPKADFAKAELAFAEARYADAARLLNNCLRTMSSEDLDFRAAVNQQLYSVHRRLARAGIRSRKMEQELESCLGMSRTATTLADEIETLFALSEAYERQDNLDNAARCLRSIITTYGHHEYPVPEIAALNPEKISSVAVDILGTAKKYAANPIHGEELTRSIELMKTGLPLYLSTVSPLPRTLTVRAGEYAAARLLRLRQGSPEFRRSFEALAARRLAGDTEARLFRLWEFPGTNAAQSVLNELFDRAAAEKTEAGRQRLWALTDAARVGGLQVPDKVQGRVLAPTEHRPPVPVDPEQKSRQVDLSDAEGINWLVLERRGERFCHPHLLFLGGRVRKRLDNKFILACFDLRTGKPAWRKEQLRLKGKGQEPGFFEAFVHGDTLVVHGLYDVLAFRVTDGEPLWRYRVPFDFEIKHALMSGNLLFLSGKTESVALYIPTPNPDGEIVWQVKEMGDVYAAPYLHGNRLVCLRKNPFNLTVRTRSTGRLIGRLDLPDLSLHDRHPLLDDGPRALPVDHDGRFLVVTDGWYYILLDAERVVTVWKRLIDNNDLTREPAMRFTLRGEYLAVIKEDYDQKVIYMLSSRTGEVLWHTDVKNPNSPQPAYSTIIQGGKMVGIGLWPGQGFYFVGMDCKTGKRLFRREVKGYDSKPKATLVPRRFGGAVVAKIQDRQMFELKTFDLETGKTLGTLREKGVGPFGIHGRVSATVQNGRLVLLSKDKLAL
jgi:outer membrane protein assembly factor BamB